ncbi:MAG: hypothetical protein R6X29_03185 [Acidimicrobiia bacterium]|jgi:hypothetical protein
MPEAARPPLEHALLVTLRFLLASLPLALVLLAVPSLDGSRLLPTVLIHLSLVVAGGLALSTVLVGRSEERWFAGGSAFSERVATASTIVVLVTGYVALVTLASSAALRLDPSLQFLQLLSALDIAWVTTATMVGYGWFLGPRIGKAASLLVAVVCVWSIWAYLDAVGFTDDGGWLVDGAALWRYVLPLDIMAAVIGVTGILVGSRRRPAAGSPEGGVTVSG